MQPIKKRILIDKSDLLVSLIYSNTDKNTAKKIVIVINL